MSDEEHGQVSAVLVAQAPVVKRGNNRLACACRSDDQVAMPIVYLPLCVERLQNADLVGQRANLEPRQGDSRPASAVARDRERIVKAIGVGRRVVPQEGLIGPIGVEGCLELAE